MANKKISDLVVSSPLLLDEIPAARAGANVKLLVGQILDLAMAGSVRADDQVIAFNNSSPVTVVVLPAGAVIQRTTVDVETPFSGGTPSLSIGVSGDPSKYMGAAEVDLLVAGVYQSEPMIEEVGSVSLIVTYSAGSASAGSARVTVQWALPG